MGIWRARPIVYSSLAICKKTIQQSFQTLVADPTVASSFPSRRFLFLSQPQRRHLFLFPQASAVVRTLSSLSSEKKQEERYIPIKTYFLCTSVDLNSLQQAQNPENVIPPSSRFTNFLVLRYYDIKNDPRGVEAGFRSESNCHYMAVFRYGSVVLFNVSDHEADGYLRIVEKFAANLLPEITKDDYLVVEKPNLETWMQGEFHCITLKTLSIEGIQTIARVLGQSVALDYYTAQVDGMIAQFTNFDRDLEKMGILTMQNRKLFQCLGKTISTFSDVFLKQSAFERSNIAQKNANYAQIWEHLSHEFKSDKFKSLVHKVKYVESKIPVFQKTMLNRTSDFLEWLVIILLSVDILISVCTIAQILISSR
ncbi:hypothetical protein J5N97_006717 [Dioscorea zingiberensis]|uniref:DUF155 domain-containing protein n=1 Tax=Dioscorea zingiberensis TaxID=325984 RepID=A0A9D5DAR3_9LILI|nr:hypothetical protein J5N97_006717 [Dioscorea zingiberensis]